MNKRIFTLTEYFNKISHEHTPELSFEAWQGDFDGWKSRALDKLTELLGEYPKKVPLNAEVEYSVDEGDYIRQRVVFDVDEIMSLPAIVLIPKGAENAPAIVCVHGHGPYGKDPVAGVRSSPEHIGEINRSNYNYGELMAREGFVTISPDLRGFGERRDPPTHLSGRDNCNVNFIKGALLGIYTLTLNIWDVKCCIDYLETMPEVDASRIGMMGLSYGGTVTTFTTAVEPRIKAADIIGYVNPFEGFAMQRSNFCGSQIVPNLYKYFDTHDVAGMISPRPLLVEMGIHDKTFFFEDLWAGYEKLSRIYEAAGAEDKLHHDIHPHGHAHSGKEAPDFFKKNL